MTCDWGFTRRTFLGSWLAALAVKAFAGSTTSAATALPAASFDPIAFTLRGYDPAAAFQRRYRMDATILLLGVPVFTRQGAGGGYASVEADQSAKAVALQFAAGSYPSRAHGLNRFGILREAVVTRGPESAGAIDVSFAGLMTRSHEESLDQGRKALGSQAAGGEGIIARGRTCSSIDESTIQSWVDKIELAPGANWSNLNQTLSDALRREPGSAPRISLSGSAVTFLYAIRSAAIRAEASHRRQFTHAGKLYWLETRRHPQRPLELDGSIHDLAGARRAEFRTAYAAGDPSGIPTRIEYRPRPFLRLVFEAQPEATQPVIPSVFPHDGPQEGA